MNRTDLKDDWPLPNNYLIELGRLSALWGVLESTVDLSINKLACYASVYDYRAAVMLAHANFKQRADILETLLEQTCMEHAELRRYDRVMKLISRSQKGRNKFMHNTLYSNPETGHIEFASMSARGKLRTRTEIIRFEELKVVSAVIHEATCALHSLVTLHNIKPIWDRGD